MAYEGTGIVPQIPELISCDRKYKEADITNNISNLVASKLRAAGYTVNVYRDNKYALDDKKFDAFVALHVDWCPNGYVSGYKVSRYGGAKGTGLNGSGDASDRLATAVWAAIDRQQVFPRIRRADISPINSEITGHCAHSHLHIGLLRREQPGIIIEMDGCVIRISLCFANLRTVLQLASQMV